MYKTEASLKQKRFSWHSSEFGEKVVMENLTGVWLTYLFFFFFWYLKCKNWFGPYGGTQVRPELV